MEFYRIHHSAKNHHYYSKRTFENGWKYHSKYHMYFLKKFDGICKEGDLVAYDIQCVNGKSEWNEIRRL